MFEEVLFLFPFSTYTNNLFLLGIESSLSVSDGSALGAAAKYLVAILIKIAKFLKSRDLSAGNDHVSLRCTTTTLLFFDR